MNDGALVSALAEARERVKELEQLVEPRALLVRAIEKERDEARAEVQRMDAACEKALAKIARLQAALREVTAGMPRDPEGRPSDGYWLGHSAAMIADAALADSVPASTLKSPSDVMGWLTPAEADALQLEHDNKAIAWMAEVARLQTELKAIKPVIDTLCAAVDIYRAEQIAREAP